VFDEMALRLPEMARILTSVRTSGSVRFFPLPWVTVLADDLR
jgi:hypothetical protein